MKTIIRKNSVFGNHKFIEIDDHRPEPVKIGTHKTVIFTEPNYKGEDTTKVVYHSTAVVSFNEHTILLNTGGYETRTTKLRMNQASKVFNLGFEVFQKDFNWYVKFNGVTKEFEGNTMSVDRSGWGWDEV